MEYLKQLLDNAVKLTELEMQIPGLERRCSELREIAADRKTQRDWANLEEPTFFQRLLGSVEKKQERARAEAREASAAYEEVKRELEGLEFQLRSLRETVEQLSGSRERYTGEKRTFLETADDDQVQKLRELETEAYKPVAIELVKQIRKHLYSARGWVQKDLQPRHFSRETRRMEFIQLADDCAEKLQELLVFFPEGSVTLGASMSQPSSYINSVSTNYSQIDLINIAVEQSQRVQAQLEAL